MKRSTRHLTRNLSLGFFFLVLLLLMLNPFFLPVASAAALTQATLRFDRLQTSQANTQVLVKVKPNDVTSLTKVRIDFAAGIGVNSTASNITTSTTGLPSECTATTVTNSQAESVNTQQVQFAVTGVNSTSTLYCFYITAGITTPSSASTEYTSIVSTRTNAAELGSTSVVNYFVNNDQITISATVPPSFTFNLGSTSTSFTANLSTSVIRSTTGVTGTVITNAANGWSAYLKGNAKLHSTANNYDINTSGSIDGSPTTLITGSEFYQLDVDETSDTQTNGSVSGEYNGGASEGGTFNSASLEQIASGTGATSTYIFTMVGKATVSGITKAGNDYADIWTVVAAGNF